MKNSRITTCIVVDGRTLRTPHTAAVAYAEQMTLRLRTRSWTSDIFKHKEFDYRAHLKLAYRRIHPIFKKLFKAK